MNRTKIANLRKKNGMNQRELSEKLGVAQATVSAWETGRNEPDNETIQKIADLFKVNFGYVAGYEPLKNRPLTDEEIIEYQNKRLIEDIEEHEFYEKIGMSETELKELQEAEEEQDYFKNGEGMYFEAYQFNKACDFMSAEQRKRALNGLKAFFPKAFQASIDPD